MNHNHHTHVWSLDGERHGLTAHVVVADDTQPGELAQLKCDVGDLTKEMSLEHTAFEIEFQSEECGMRPSYAPQRPIESPGSWPGPHEHR